MPSDKSGDPRQGADRSAIRSTRPGLSIAASVPGHKTAPMVPGLVLVDAWRYADPMSPGWTWDRPNPYVAATGEPSARIDNVLVGLPRPLAPIRVESVRLIGDQPLDGIWPPTMPASWLSSSPPRSGSIGAGGRMPTDGSLDDQQALAITSLPRRLVAAAAPPNSARRAAPPDRACSIRATPRAGRWRRPAVQRRARWHWHQRTGPPASAGWASHRRRCSSSRRPSSWAWCSGSQWRRQQGPRTGRRRSPTARS
jgi:hypothetical protein